MAWRRQRLKREGARIRGRVRHRIQLGEDAEHSTVRIRGRDSKTVNTGLEEVSQWWRGS